MSNINQPSFDKATFMNNFQGVEDLAADTISSFLDTLPELTLALEASIQNGKPSEIEISAHTLKGVISNFYAEPARLAVWKLEQMGRGNNLEGLKTAFSNLKIELDRLEQDLKTFLNERRAK